MLEPINDDTHVIPLNNTIMHEINSDCACLPHTLLEELDDGTFRYIVVHNAWDGRQ